MTRTWEDLSIELLGTAEYAYELAIYNDSTLTSIPKERDDEGNWIVKIPPELEQSADRAVLNYYKQNKLSPLSGLNYEDEQKKAKREGIGFWFIEQDFVVS